MREVVEHTPHEIDLAARDQPEHGEVGIPVVDLAKATTRDDVWMWKGDQRGELRRRIRGRRTSEYRPERTDVLLHRVRRVRVEGGLRRPRQREVPYDERP